MTYLRFGWNNTTFWIYMGSTLLGIIGVFNHFLFYTQQIKVYLVAIKTKFKSGSAYTPFIFRQALPLTPAALNKVMSFTKIRIKRNYWFFLFKLMNIKFYMVPLSFKTLEWWISRLMLDPLFYIISRLI